MKNVTLLKMRADCATTPCVLCGAYNKEHDECMFGCPPVDWDFVEDTPELSASDLAYIVDLMLTGFDKGRTCNGECKVCPKHLACSTYCDMITSLRRKSDSLFGYKEVLDIGDYE